MTNILLLPQFDGANTAFAINTGSDWVDTLLFTAPGSPTTPIIASGGSMTSGSATVTNLTAAIVAGLIPGQPVSGIGIPVGATLLGIASATSVTLSANATLNNAEAVLTFQPTPLDITGIAFRSQVRSAVGDPVVQITAQTSDGTMVNGGTTGTLSYAVLKTGLSQVVPNQYVLDIVATADGHVINLFSKSGPASLVMRQSVTL